MAKKPSIMEHFFSPKELMVNYFLDQSSILFSKKFHDRCLERLQNVAVSAIIAYCNNTSYNGFQQSIILNTVPEKDLACIENCLSHKDYYNT